MGCGRCRRLCRDWLTTGCSARYHDRINTRLGCALIDVGGVLLTTSSVEGSSSYGAAFRAAERLGTGREMMPPQARLVRVAHAWKGHVVPGVVSLVCKVHLWQGALWRIRASSSRAWCRMAMCRHSLGCLLDRRSPTCGASGPSYLPRSDSCGVIAAGMPPHGVPAQRGIACFPVAIPESTAGFSIGVSRVLSKQGGDMRAYVCEDTLLRRTASTRRRQRSAGCLHRRSRALAEGSAFASSREGWM